MSTTLQILLLLVIPLVGILTAIMPYLMKKNECFAVTVPETAQSDPFLKGLKRRYLAIMLLFTVVATVTALAAVLTNQRVFLVVVLIGATLLMMLFGYGLMLRYHSKVRLYKKQQSWIAVSDEAVASLHVNTMPGALPLIWNLLYVPVILFTLAVCVFGYELMPEQLPFQVGFDGEVTTLVEKDPLAVAFPVFIQAFMALCFLFSHWTIARSKHSVNPSSPASSSYAYGMFARAQSIYLLTLGLILTALMVMIPFSFMGLITLVQAGIVVVIGAIVAVIGSVAISAVYGQGGSRLFARMQESGTLPADEDHFWKLGVFYFNKEDPSLFLLKRFGIGWTVNFARPLVWLILAAIVVATGAVIIMTTFVS